MKSNNPFTMIGSYIGLIIGLILGYFSYSTILVLCEFGNCKFSAYLLPLIPIVLGFLIGWFINNKLHSKNNL